MAIRIHNLYTIKQIDNGYILTIHEESSPTVTGDDSYFDSLSRLITHLTNKINELSKEEK
jgi:hypothetical protein